MSTFTPLTKSNKRTYQTVKRDVQDMLEDLKENNKRDLSILKIRGYRKNEKDIHFQIKSLYGIIHVAFRPLATYISFAVGHDSPSTQLLAKKLNRIFEEKAMLYIK